MRKDPPKIESAQDWEKAKNFIPKKDQIIIYDGIKQDGRYIMPPRIKIGDGQTTVNELPFENSSPDVLYVEENGILIIN